MTEMVRRYLRQKSHNLGVVIALGALALLAAFQLAASGGDAGLEIGTPVVFILAAACVSKDASSGALQMILSRPIRRSEYLMGRFAGVLAGYGVFLLDGGGSRPRGVPRSAFDGSGAAADVLRRALAGSRRIDADRGRHGRSDPDAVDVPSGLRRRPGLHPPDAAPVSAGRGRAGVRRARARKGGNDPAREPPAEPRTGARCSRATTRWASPRDAGCSRWSGTSRSGCSCSAEGSSRMDRTEQAPLRAPESQSKLSPILLWVLAAAIVFRVLTAVLDKDTKALRRRPGELAAPRESGGPRAASRASRSSTTSPPRGAAPAGCSTPTGRIRRSPRRSTRRSCRRAIVDRQREDGKNPPDVEELQRRFEVVGVPHARGGHARRTPDRQARRLPRPRGVAQVPEGVARQLTRLRVSPRPRRLPGTRGPHRDRAVARGDADQRGPFSQLEPPVAVVPRAPGLRADLPATLERAVAVRLDDGAGAIAGRDHQVHRTVDGARLQLSSRPHAPGQRDADGSVGRLQSQVAAGAGDMDGAVLRFGVDLPGQSCSEIGPFTVRAVTRPERPRSPIGALSASRSSAAWRGAAISR